MADPVGEQRHGDEAPDIVLSRDETMRMLHEHPLGVLVVGFDGQVLYVNARGTRMLGLEKASDIDRDARHLYADPHLFDRLVATFRAEGQIPEIDVEMQRDGASNFWAKLSGKGTIFGQAEAIILWVREIADRRRSSDLLTAELFDAAPLPMLLCSLPDGEVVRTNRRAVELYVAQQVPTGCRLEDITGVGTFQALLEILRDRGGLINDFEVPLRTPYGETFPGSISGQIVTIGSTRSLLVGISDITERKRAEQAIKEQSEQVAGLLNNAGQGFLSFGQDLLVADAYSQACNALLGGEPAGRRVDEILFPTDPAAQAFMRGCIADAMAVTDPGRKEMFLSLLPSKIEIGTRTLEVEFRPFAMRIMAVISDITEKRKLERRVAREIQRMEIIIAAVTDSGDFFATVDEFRAFALAGAEPWQKEGDRATLYRIIHTFKGSFSQFGFYHIPLALHEAEASMQVPVEDEIEGAAAAAVFSVNWIDLLERDLSTVIDALGADFVEAQGIIPLSSEQAQRFKKLASRLMELAQIGAADRSGLAELKSIGSVSLKTKLQGFDRMVNSIATRLNKEVARLKVDGEEVQIDPERFGPLLTTLGHVFRNAVDHGIEDPEIRFAAGKSEQGTISCRISGSPSEIVLEIADDGAGIDEEALRRRAIRLLGDESRTWSLAELVFADGLSSREEATSISGRGIGMAAVRAEVDRLGGEIEVQSRANVGTRFIFRIPRYNIRGEHVVTSDREIVDHVMASVVGRTKRHFIESLGIVSSSTTASAGTIDTLALRDLTAITGLAGPVSVMIAFSFDHSLAAQVFEVEIAGIRVADHERAQFLMETVAETINVVLGHCTEDLARAGEDVILSVPIVIADGGQLRRPKGATFTRISIGTPYGIMDAIFITPSDLFGDYLNMITT